MNPEYSFIIPIYNEGETFQELYRQMSAFLTKLDGPAEVILIDDGSSDDSYAQMDACHQRDARFKTIRLSRNFGHQIAITAGMDYATGAAIVIMDADLQDPPEVVLEMAKRWREGYQVVYAMRQERQGESWLKKITAAMFYRLLRKLTDINIPLDTGDFRLVDRQALQAFNQMREHGRFVRGMFSWVGFKQTGVRYVRSPRFAGTTKYPFKKMVRLAIDGVLSFSNAPLRMALNLGFIISAASFIFGITAIVFKLMDVETIPGWASIIAVFTFMGGAQLVVLGIVGEYVGRIYDEVRRRPLYFVRDTKGLPTTPLH